MKSAVTMTHTHDTTRRQLLKSGLAVAATGPAAFALNLAHMNLAAAQSSSTNDYKALICLFMHGGNDQGNTIIATNGDSWKNYEDMRGGTIALGAPGAARHAVLPFQPANLSAFGNSGVQLALHPRLPKTRELFRQRKLAIISNVGPLIAPTTAEEYRQNITRTPARLYSHNDQQSCWQTFSPEGNSPGWGGRMVDLLMSQYNAPATFASAIAPGNRAESWLVGRQSRPYSMPSQGAIGIPITGSLRQKVVGDAFRAIITAQRDDNILAQTYTEMYQRSLAHQQQLQESLVAEDHPSLLKVPGLPDSPRTPNPLAVQMRVVARMIASRHQLGVRRQVFFLSLPGFDTHDSQVNTQAWLFGQLDQALDYFDQQMKALGVVNQVTLFTASDFGRGMVSNGTGTDHGWGGHHFVYGGAVNGGNLYGQFPTFGFDVGQDVRGRLVPQFSVEQYAAELGRWFGLTQSELHDVLPNLINFPRNSGLNFMKA